MCDFSCDFCVWNGSKICCSAFDMKEVGENVVDESFSAHRAGKRYSENWYYGYGVKPKWCPFSSTTGLTPKQKFAKRQKTTLEKLGSPKVLFSKKCDDKVKNALIEKWLDENLWYTTFYISDDYLISSKDDDLYIDYEGEELPDFINFYRVEKSFSLRGGNFKSLKGCPVYVGGYFKCSNNKIKTLKYAPLRVGLISGGSFNCSNNFLEDLQYCPVVENGSIYAYNNKLKNLNGIQEVINGDLIVKNNEINTLKYHPRIIKGCFDISKNLLASRSEIEECDMEIFGDFSYKKNLVL